jgi:hypothetical protein
VIPVGIAVELVVVQDALDDVAGLASETFGLSPEYLVTIKRAFWKCASVHFHNLTLLRV